MAAAHEASSISRWCRPRTQASEPARLHWLCYTADYLCHVLGMKLTTDAAMQADSDYQGEDYEVFASWLSQGHGEAPERV